MDERIKNLDTPKKCEIFAKNALNAGREDLVKQAKHEAEEAKIGIRNHRKDANTDIKKEEKNGTAEDICKKAEEDVQKLTDNFIKKIDEILAVKEAEIMKV